MSHPSRDGTGAARPLHIAHVTGESGFSGGEVQLFLLIEGLARRGHRNTLVCPPDSRSALRAAELSVPCEPVPMRNSFSPRGVRGTLAALRRRRPDLVHLHTGRANWIGGLAAARLGLPAITTRRMDRAVKRGPRTRWLYGRGVAHAVAISETVRQRLLDGGVPAEKISLIPSAVDPATLRPARERGDLRRELGVANGAFCLLALARLTRRKGIDLLLDALARLEAPPLLLVAGDGDERAALEAQRDRAGLRERVRFLGRREDKACLLSACDAFVMPSRQEGLGVAALEALACGRPVVASRVGGLAESVRDGENGLLVTPDDSLALARAIERLQQDPELRARLGAAGPKRVAEGHLAEQMCDAYEALYRRVLGTRAA